jgi:hypothetical protein
VGAFSLGIDAGEFDDFVGDHDCPINSRTISTGCKAPDFLPGKEEAVRPIKWAFSRKARHSKSVELCRG